MKTIFFHLFTFRFLPFIFLQVQEYEGENEHSYHHGECRSVIRVSARYKSLVLGMLQWTDGHLRSTEKSCIANPVIINLELIDTVNVWNFELGFVLSGRLSFYSRADEGVDPHKLELDVICVERLPLAIFENVNFDGVHLILIHKNVDKYDMMIYEINMISYSALYLPHHP